MAMPATAPQMPIARVLSRDCVKVLVMIAIATGFSIEPPRACSTRNATSQPMLGARPQASDPRPNRAMPIWKTSRRPKRSAMEPASMSRLATTNV